MAVALALSVGACGWAEWPPAGRRITTSAPPPQATQDAEPAPAAAAAPIPAEPPESVLVREGDTVYALSNLYQVSVRGIIEANDLKPPYRLVTGQRLLLPREVRHIVARGDSLSGIARQYGVDQTEIARLNALDPPYTIQTGRQLRVPRLPAGTPPAGAAPVSAPAPVTSAGVQSQSLPPPPPADAPQPPLPAEVPTAGAVREALETVSAPPPKAADGFVWPVRGQVVSTFGAKEKGLFNDGINIAAPQGTPVVAADGGVVVYAGNELRGFGNLVLLKHDGGWITAYAHNERLLVNRGDKVERGQRIAHVGATGNVRSPQLHFEVRRGKTPVDPRRFLSGDA